MIHIFKASGKKLAYDSSAGTIIPLSGLHQKMLDALKAPLEPILPTSLRYELAKYDSEDVETAYSYLYDLFCDGFIFAEDDGTVRLRVSGEYSAANEEEIKLALELARSEGAKDVVFPEEGALLDIAKELKKEIFR